MGSGRGRGGRQRGRVRGKALEGRAGEGRRGGPGAAVPEEERPVHLVCLVVVALLDAGAQLALHALHAAAVPAAAAFRGFLLRRHDRRRHQRGGRGGEAGAGRMRTEPRRPAARLPPVRTAAREAQPPRLRAASRAVTAARGAANERNPRGSSRPWRAQQHRQLQNN